MRTISVVGARPNFMKVAPIHLALRRHGHDSQLVHTGQHYDANMSAVFFEDLGMPRPDINLEVGSASHAIQTARVMEAFEPLLVDQPPDWVMVAGDVNSTIACALVAVKLGIPVAHLEAGLRSFDRRMPEEINRMLTDRISALLLTPSRDADDNLLREGVPDTWIERVGNAMIDSLRQHQKKARALDTLARLALSTKGYAMLTLHRPANVDQRTTLSALLEVLDRLADRIPIVFPAHPRTRSRLEEFDLLPKNVRLIEPLGYLEFLALQMDAALVLTDSGGIQEETTALGVPCLTLRDTTERPVTVSEGTNTVVGNDPETIWKAAASILKNGGKAGRIPELWDGHTADRVVTALVRHAARDHFGPHRGEA